MEGDERSKFMSHLGFIMQNKFNEQAEGLLQWSENLGALGRALYWLRDLNDSGGAYMATVEQFGHIIEDYAFLINHVTGQAYGAINSFFHNEEHTLISRAKERYTRLKGRGYSCPADIYTIDSLLKEMRPVLTDALVLRELLAELEKIRKEIETELGSRNKTTPGAAQATESGAQANDVLAAGG